VDARGADPVPEHDSHGQLIYLAAEYWRHTGDRSTLDSVWPNVVRAAEHLDSLRRDREACKTVTIEGERYELGRLSLWDLEALAEKRVRASLERSIRRRGDAIEEGRGL